MTEALALLIEPQQTAAFLASCFATKPEAGAFEQMLVVAGMMQLPRSEWLTLRKSDGLPGMRKRIRWRPRRGPT